MKRHGVSDHGRLHRSSCSGASLPVAWIFSLSLKPVAETTAGSAQFLPQSYTWDNYVEVFNNPDFRRALVNSFGISFIATALSVMLATLAAYAIARLDFRGKRIVLTIALAIAIFPVVSLVGPLFDHVAGAGPVQHLARADHPVHVVHAAARDLDVVGVLP